MMRAATSSGLRVLQLRSDVATFAAAGGFRASTPPIGQHRLRLPSRDGLIILVRHATTSPTVSSASLAARAAIYGHAQLSRFAIV